MFKNSKKYLYLTQMLLNFPEGASLYELLDQTPSLKRRTLQRHLREMVLVGELTIIGSGSGSRYKSGKKYKILEGSNEPHPEFFQFPTVFTPSVESEKILTYLAQPLSSRARVSYQHQFIERYIPNKSYYLSIADRKLLFSIGEPKGQSMPGCTFAREIYNRLLIDLSWNSSRLEGNTYSLLETENLLVYGSEITSKSKIDVDMILNHKAAIEYLVETGENLTIDSLTIRSIHALLSELLLSNPRSCGALRTIAIGITGTSYMPLAIPQLVEQFFQEIIVKAAAIENPFEQAFFLMVHVPYLQPFEDVNKRTSRLAANIPLIKNNLCPLSFVNVSSELYVSALLGIYELNDYTLLKDLFLWAYYQSAARFHTIRSTISEPDPFFSSHRTKIKETVREIMIGMCNKVDAAKYIQQKAIESFPAKDQSRFIEIVETELISLNVASAARYKITPKTFNDWQIIWNGLPN